MDPTHANMIYGKFDKYFGKYDDPTFKKGGGRAPIAIPTPGAPAVPVTSPNLAVAYDNVFELSYKINSLVEKIEPTDLQEPEKMKEKLSRAYEISTKLAGLADAQSQVDEQRGGFVNFWCRLGNALIGRGWLTGGERGVELAQEMVTHIKEKQKLVQLTKIKENLKTKPELVLKDNGPNAPQANTWVECGNKPDPQNPFGGTTGPLPIFVIIDEEGNITFAKLDNTQVALKDYITEPECEVLKELLAYNTQAFYPAVKAVLNDLRVKQQLALP